LERVALEPIQLLAEAGAAEEGLLNAVASSLSPYFGYAIDTTTLDRSLQTLLPNLLREDQNVSSFFFVEAGMTIYDLNILLDSQPDKVRLGLKTMGSASAQTIGALSPPERMVAISIEPP
jgi:hypothetical protein